MPSPRSRAWCFTLNNYEDADCGRIAALACRYVIIGKEVAPGTGTPHLQGYIYFENARSLGGVRRLLPGCHLSVARGTPDQNRVYCSKEGDFVEMGVLPADPTAQGDGEVDRWDAAYESAKRGALDEIPTDMLVRYYSTWKRIVQDYMPRVPNLTDVCGIWIYGSSGAGKSRSVGQRFPLAFEKPRTKWWDGYQGESVVVCDDVDKYNVSLGGDFKDWADYKTFIGEFKGGSRRIRPRLFIVTSQYRIGEIWSDPQTQEALGRRFILVEKVIGVDLVWPGLVEEIVENE